MKIVDGNGVPIDLGKEDKVHGKNLQFFGLVFLLCTLGLSCLPYYFWLKSMRVKYSGGCSSSSAEAEEGMMGSDGVTLGGNQDMFPAAASPNSNNSNIYQRNQSANPFDYN